jgi:hypothetical protein
MNRCINWRLSVALIVNFGAACAQNMPTPEDARETPFRRPQLGKMCQLPRTRTGRTPGPIQRAG